MLEKKEFEIPSEKFKKGATLYTDSDTPVKAAIIYFHGGGLLYGRRKDLPRPHLNTLTQAGYAIIAFDYPLAPAAKLEMIMNDVESSIQYYIDHSDELIKNPKSSEGSLPYFLWGRSAGAYLCLIARNLHTGTCRNSFLLWIWIFMRQLVQGTKQTLLHASESSRKCSLCYSRRHSRRWRS